MEQEDIFVALPFTVKTYYDDLKTEISRIDNYLDKISEIHASNKKKLKEITDALLNMNNDIRKLFADISSDKNK